MMSILVPSRARPDWLWRLVCSALDTALGEIEIIVRIDDDDESYEGLVLPKTTFVKGPRNVLSELWNECYELARGPYYFHCGDDIVMKTRGWDLQVIAAFPADKIAAVHGDDLDPNHLGVYGSHCFLHRRWVDAVGYFVPPYFSSDYNDTWINDVANMIDRRVFVPVITEHMHPAFGKAPIDQTHKERLERHAHDNVDQLYVDLKEEREKDAQKLLAVIRGCAG